MHANFCIPVALLTIKAKIYNNAQFTPEMQTSFRMYSKSASFYLQHSLI